eukprot:m.85882 g.85882  ORF g.85882 m.85882 type:complete len:703 (-) comp14855_c0_seq2:1393-3501(-)
MWHVRSVLAVSSLARSARAVAGRGVCAAVGTTRRVISPSIVPAHGSGATMLQRTLWSSSTCASPLERTSPAYLKYKDMYDRSIADPDAFWSQQSTSLLKWRRPFDTVRREDLTTGEIVWFEGGKLNVAENCVDRHAREDPDRVALIWEADDPTQGKKVTYGELLQEVCRLANLLKRRGVRKGDRVCMYMPMTPHAVYAMLACARIGAPHSVVFAGFSADALRSRIQNARCSVVITADEGVRGGKTIPLKDTVIEALEGCNEVHTLLVSKRTGANVASTPIDVPLEEEMAKERPYCPLELVDSEDPLFLLYTSGSTGTPKGLTHTSGGYLTYAALTHKHVFDYKPGDVYACVADVGWITGHTYVVYGPLANGATTLLFESIPTYPDASRYWQMIEKHRINQFYTAPTAIRLLIKHGREPVDKHDLSSLRVLGTVGEPINPEAWNWYNDVVGKGKCTIADTWWQTETGGIMITAQPGFDHIKPGAALKPFFGVEPVLLDDKGNILEGNDQSGVLCIKHSVPSMARSVFEDHERFLDVYLKPYPGYYFSGDGAHRDEDGDYWITGRVDDVINVSGHRLGTAEVESALVLSPRVAEAAVVGMPHDIKGEGIYAFVTPKAGVEPSAELVNELKELVRHEIGSLAKPDVVQLCENLPKTRSGKIMRRVLRKVAANKTDDMGDVSTLAEPEVVQDLIRQAGKLRDVRAV